MIIPCLVLGWLAFILYNLRAGYRLTELIRYSAQGIYNARVVIITMALVGMLTGLWRSAGTIAYIVSLSIRLIQPQILLLCVFLLNCLVSFLIGTSFGTVATTGIICMILANASGMSPFWSGGAILSGIYFGDRCSMISSSAMLVAEVTKTDLYDNIHNMLLAARVPFVITCLVYLAAGFLTGGGSGEVAGLPDFGLEFHLVFLTLLPAVAVLLLAILRVNVRVSIFISCLCAAVICLLVQKQTLMQIWNAMIFGYQAKNAEMASMISGGGFMSMMRVFGIITISSTYAGLIKNTKMTEVLTSLAQKLQTKLNRTGCTIVVGTIISMIGCNQTLAIMLTGQFCESLYQDEPSQLALDLEDTVVVIAPLIPWCIAGAVPVATIAAPQTCLLAACYLYLLPIYAYLRGRKR